MVTLVANGVFGESAQADGEKWITKNGMFLENSGTIFHGGIGFFYDGYSNVPYKVNGRVKSADASGVHMSSGSDNTLTVGTSGAVRGFTYGVTSNGANSIIDSAGLLFSKHGHAVRLQGADAQLNNTGTIKGDIGIYVTGARAEIVNHGVIKGTSGVAIENVGSAITLNNTGVIKGDVEFGGGADIYDALGTGVVKGDVVMGNGDDSFQGANAEDRVFFSDGTNTGFFAGGDDYVSIDNGTNTMLTESGDDVAEISGGFTSLSMGSGNDEATITGGMGTVDMGAGKDKAYVDGASVADWDFYMGGGKDRIEVISGAAEAYGEAGNDKMIGGLLDDILHGGSGADKIISYAGDDVLSGAYEYGDFPMALSTRQQNKDKDTIKAGDGADEIFGAFGDDKLYGGGADGDADTFIYSYDIDNGHDTIFDFEDGVDQIALKVSGGTGVIADYVTITDVGADAHVVFGFGTNVWAEMTLIGQAGAITDADFTF